MDSSSGGAPSSNSSKNVITKDSTVDKNNEEKQNIPRQVLHDVEHFKQRSNWDCGVSCVLMLLSPEQRIEFLDNFDAICQEEGFGRSTWTVDLCYLLKRFNIKHCMYTTKLGVNENLKKFSYYGSIMDLDKERVQRRFDEAEARGITIREGTLGADDLRNHLALHGPIIVLVDAGLLVCNLCKHNKLRFEFRRCFGGSYTGHYVVVVGHTAQRDAALYHDPALRPRICLAPQRVLDAARNAPGTDHDVVLIYNKNR